MAFSKRSLRLTIWRSAGKAGVVPSLLLESRNWWNSPYINHFISADTIIPDQGNPQSWDRYSYVNNNPLRYTDPTGHRMCEDFGGSCVSENQMTQIVRIHQRRTRHYSDNRQKDDVATAPMGSSGTGGPGSVNINLGPNGVTIYNGPVFAGVIPVGDLQISWSPSLTLNNGSQVIVSPGGITYGPPAAPVAPRFSMTGNGPSVGYVDSPIFNSPALSGLSIPFPQMGQVKMSTTQIVRTQSMSFVSRVDVSYTARPDYAAAAAPYIAGAALFALTGNPSGLEDLVAP